MSDPTPSPADPIEQFARATRRLNGGGSSKIVWWIMAGISSAIVAGFSGWISSMYSKVEAANASTIRQEERMGGMEKRLERIENKLDQIRNPK